VFFSSFRPNSYLSYLGVRLFGFLSSMSRWVLRFFSFLGELVICGGETAITPFVFVFFFLKFLGFVFFYFRFLRSQTRAKHMLFLPSRRNLVVKTNKN